MIININAYESVSMDFKYFVKEMNKIAEKDESIKLTEFELLMIWYCIDYHESSLDVQFEFHDYVETYLKQ